MKKVTPLLGKERDKLVSKAMTYNKRDLAILYVDLKWCFDQIVKSKS